MPEGVELRISAELVRPLVVNKPIVSAFQSNTGRYGNKSIDGHGDFLDALKQKVCYVENVNVKGKFMYWTFNNGQYMFSTFGMTGQWAPKPGKHPCFAFYFEDGSEIHFNDPRHFGTIKFTNNKNDLIEKLNDLGWDPFTMLDSPTENFIINKLAKSNKTIAHVLMDQSIFAGVGNYIRAEALYLAKLAPKRLCSSLTKDEILSLCRCIIEVMETSYKYQGATLHTYKDSYGNEGKYSSLFKVYGRKTDDLGNKIVKETSTEGRTIHWCPAVQI
jgi:formamidopyrimidine-DNA glycosylase